MCEDSMSIIQRRIHLQSATMKFMIKECWSSYNVWKSEMQNWEVCQVFRFVQITRIWNTSWQLKSLQSDKWDDFLYCHNTISSYYTC